jgi:hypothetical protein
MFKIKRTNTINDLQNTTQKTKDRVARTPLKPGVESGAPEGLADFAPLVTPDVLRLKDAIITWYGYRVGHQYI